MPADDGSCVGEQELIVRFPAAKIRFGTGTIIVSATALMLAVPVAFCLWLLLLFVSHVLFLAGWGSGDLLLIHGETSWIPVVGAGLAIFTVTLPLAWLIARIVAHWWRRVRNAWWLRLSREGFEVNDRLFVPRRYRWHEIDKFMLVVAGGHVEDAVLEPQKTYAEAFQDGATYTPPTMVGFRYSPGGGRRRSPASRLFFQASSLDGTRADGSVMGYWDRPFDQAVDLMNEWLARHTSI